MLAKIEKLYLKKRRFNSNYTRTLYNNTFTYTLLNILYTLRIQFINQNLFIKRSFNLPPPPHFVEITNA